MSCGGNAVGEGLQSTLTKLNVLRDRRLSHGLEHGRRAECLCPGPLAETDSQCRVWNADEDGVGEGVSGNAHLLSSSVERLAREFLPPLWSQETLGEENEGVPDTGGSA